MSRWALQLAYDGGDFHGYQALPGRRTVQGELEACLSRLLQQPVATVCAGRTDAGVHAFGQFVSFDAAPAMPPETLLRLLQQRLPPDLSAVGLWQCAADFHARFSARARHYRYLLNTGPPDPFRARYAWHYPYPLEAADLAKAWAQCLGTHDFAPFARSGGSRRRSEITVWVASLRQDDCRLALDIVADSFLYGMVRNLVGTALDIARGRLPQDAIQALLQAKSGRPGISAPPQGLYFCRALYAPVHGLALSYPDPLPLGTEAAIPPGALRDPGKWWDD